MIVAFQPHRYSRTQHLFDEFSLAFNGADELVLTDIYPAGEAPIEGITAEHLAKSISEHGHHSVEFIADKSAVARRLAELSSPGDVVIALGAGDINRVLEDVKQHITGGTP